MTTFIAWWVFQVVLVLILVFQAKSRASTCKWDAKLTERRLTWGISIVVIIQIADFFEEYSSPGHHGLGPLYHIQWIGVYWIALAVYRRKYLRAMTADS